MSRGSPIERVDARYLPGWGMTALVTSTSRSSMSRERLARGHGDHVGDAFGAGNRRSKFGDGSHQIDVRQVLQRTHLVLSQRALAADVQNRTLRTERGGDAGDGIRAPGSGGGDDAAELARLARIAVGRVRGDLFVANIDDADALIDAAIINIDDVAAAKSEYRVDTLVLQRLRDQMTSRDHARVAALSLQGIFRSRGLGLNRRGVYGCHVASNFVNLASGRHQCRPEASVESSNLKKSSSNHRDPQIIEAQSRAITRNHVGRGAPATPSDADENDSCPLAKCFSRMGFSTNSASSAAITLNVIARVNTADHP
jgi:hypothetical protein